MRVITGSTLVFWLCCYIGGMLLSLTKAWSFLLIFSALLFLTGAFCHRFVNVLRVYFVFAPLFFVTGGASMERVFPKQNDNLTGGENYYIATIEQQLSAGKAWNTNLVRLQSGKTRKGKWERTDERVLLLTENGETSLEMNDVILFRTGFKEINTANNPGEFNAKMYWYSKGVRYQGFTASDEIKLIEYVPLGWFDVSLETVRNYSSEVLDKWVGEENAPLIKAILLGDKSDLDTETKRIFTNTGAMHMLAVSGMHIGLIVVLLGGVFKRLFFYRGRVAALWIMILLLWFYAFLTGFSASVTRAVVMFTVLIFAGFMRRGYQPVNSLSVAGFFILVWDPMAIFDIGFQLSFLAMVGIFAVYPMMENLMKFKWNLLNTTWQGTAIGLASQVFTVPISVYYFNQFPNYFILTNFGVMLFSGIMLGLAIGLLAFGKIMILSVPAGWFLALSCSLLVGFIAYVEMIPGSLAVGFTPGWSWVVVMYILIFVSLYWLERKKWLPVLGCLLPAVIWLQLDRMDNLYKKEWVIFNSNHTIILVNDGGDQVCLYDGTEKSLQQAKRIVEDYQKVHPGTISFFPLTTEKYVLTVGKEKLILTPRDGWIEITAYNGSYALVTSNKVTISSLDKRLRIISKRNDSEKRFFDLSKSAFRKALED